MTKYKVPDGMLKSVPYLSCSVSYKTVVLGDNIILPILEAAIHWLSENPIVPTQEQSRKLYRSVPQGLLVDEVPSWYAEEWQRRMFVEPEVPEEIKDLLWEGHPKTRHDLTNEYLNKQLLEAYRRGQKNPISS